MMWVSTLTEAAAVDGSVSTDGTSRERWFNSEMRWLEQLWRITTTMAVLSLSIVEARASSRWQRMETSKRLFRLVILIIYSNCHLGENNVIISLNEIAGLPAGTYCNIIDDCATSVTVDASGMGAISITNYDEPILALCPGCPTLPTLPTSGPTASTTPGTTLPTTPLPTLGPGAKRTVIFIQKQTNPGQDLFIRGGIDATVRPPCTDITSLCSIPFKVPIQHAIRLIYNELH